MGSELVYPFPLPQNVGINFVEQYYNILHFFPEEAYKFYQDSSVITRAGTDGKMTTVTAMKGINGMLLSLDYKNCGFEISTIDAQRSFNGGVLIMVTGYLTGKDNIKRMFSQVFFLAPQEIGLFVLNDIFNYFDSSVDGCVDDDNVDSPKTPDPVEIDDGFKSDLSSENKNPPSVKDAEGDQANGHVLENENETADEIGLHALENEKETAGEIGLHALGNEKETADEIGLHALEKEKETLDEIGLVKEDPIVVRPKEIPEASEEAAPTISEDTKIKSFATMANALNDNAAPFQRVSPAKLAGKPQFPSAPKSSSQKMGTEVHKTNMPAVKSHAIFVPNLPMATTVEELEQLFMTFGSIKPNGIQVRSKQASCFGFVEFESAISMQNALKASPILFCNRKLFIEERRGASSGNGGYRNDNYRPRSNYGKGQSNGHRQGQGREFVGRPQWNNRGDYYSVGYLSLN